MIDSCWVYRSFWPEDRVGYVFLARAIERVGKACFGENWTAPETELSAARPSPDTQNASSRLKEFDTIQNLVTEACGSGKVSSVGRSIGGSDKLVIPTEWWFGWTDKKIATIFLGGGFDYNDPYDKGYQIDDWGKTVDENMVHLYLNESELNSFLENCPYSETNKFLLPKQMSIELKVILMLWREWEIKLDRNDVGYMGGEVSDALKKTGTVRSSTMIKHMVNILRTGLGWFDKGQISGDT